MDSERGTIIVKSLPHLFSRGLLIGPDQLSYRNQTCSAIPEEIFGFARSLPRRFKRFDFFWTYVLTHIWELTYGSSGKCGNSELFGQDLGCVVRPCGSRSCIGDSGWQPSGASFAVTTWGRVLNWAVVSEIRIVRDQGSLRLVLSEISNCSKTSQASGWNSRCLSETLLSRILSDYVSCQPWHDQMVDAHFVGKIRPNSDLWIQVTSWFLC